MRHLIIPDVLADPRTKGSAGAWARLDTRALVNLPVIEHGRLVAVMLLQDRHPREWTEEKLILIRQAADLTRAEVERRRAEQQQRLLNEELAHRVKNTLAMVNAVAAQTIRTAASLPEAGAAVQARIAALASAHDALMQNSWTAARIRSVVGQALQPHGGDPNPQGGAERFTIEGPDLMIGPKPALAMALMLHELATNAVKYGALSTPDGHVALAWEIDEAGPAADVGGDGQPGFRFVWRESGGPPVAPPARRGFGSRLIERGLAGNFGGSVRLDYEPDGVVCTLTAPLASVLASGRA